MGQRFTSQDLQRLVNKGNVKVRGIDLLIPSKQISGGLLFGDSVEDMINHPDNKEFNFFFPGDPMPKQSVRHAPKRHMSNGFHLCPWTNKSIPHKKGDVIVFRNKQGIVDVPIISYQPAKYANKIKEIRNIITNEHPRSLPLISERVFITRWTCVFPMLKSFSKALISHIESGGIHFKETKPDLIDNLKKLYSDAMSGIVYNDDANVVYIGESMKIYGTTPGVYITLKGK